MNDADRPTDFDQESAQPTQSRDKSPADETPSELAPKIPARIGRYQLMKQLGRGGFGFVYLADDPSLNRQVAIKVPRWDKPLSHDAHDRFLYEGRMLAQVNHPSIVTVYDVAATDDDIPFVVMEYIEGRSLNEVLKSRELDQENSLEVLLKIAEALREAHKQSIIHRDLKPANVIIDKDGEIHLVDFGLALHDELTAIESESGIPGTPGFMAPEQIRGENHRIDGQTDVWAFGVMMYVMLVDKMPFKGKDRDLARAICYRNPKPLRQLNDHVSKQLERICLRCLQKLMDERYQSMADVIEELQAAIRERELARQSAVQMQSQTGNTVAALQQFDPGSQSGRGDSSIPGRTDSIKSGSTGITSSEPLHIVPKGLRPFDQNDKDFFLRLLPGPTDRYGVPESIRFWVSRLDVKDQVEDVPVGLIYGPSGCGKSSFVRAGLIPRLSSSVVPVYVDCTTEDLPGQIVNRIHREINSVPIDHELSDTLRKIRLGEYLQAGDKLLIVMDQFEQWLQESDDYNEQALTEALRHCDSLRVQCLLLVRDDFWMSVSQFFRSLEQRIEDSKNALSLPLFDERHGRKVLEAYGRAYHALPPEPKKLNRTQKRFLSEAVKSLAKQGHVVCVHMAVFAETMRSREWSLHEIKSIGGWEGVGREFVFEKFSHLYLGPRQDKGELAKQILAQLLPDSLELSFTELKGLKRSRRELSAVVKTAADDTLFEQTIDFLESETHLISRVEAPNSSNLRKENERETDPGPFFQLTHDFLVRPLRKMIESNKLGSRRGRNEIRLRELSELWKVQPRTQSLPSFAELVAFFTYVDRQTRNRHYSLIRAAIRYYGVIILIGVLLAIALGVIAWRVRETQVTRQTALSVDQFMNASTNGYALRLEQIADKHRAIPFLEQELTNVDQERKYRANYALAYLSKDDVRQRITAITEELFEIDESNISSLLTLFSHHSKIARPAVLNAFERAEQPRQRAMAAAILLQLGDATAATQLLELRDDPTDRTGFVHGFRDWHVNLSGPFKALDEVNDAAFRSGLCLAIGNVPMDRIELDDQKTVATKLERIFLDPESSGGEHSAAEWVLGVLEPDSRRKKPELAEGLNWRAKRLGSDRMTTFVSIPPGKYTRAQGLPDALVNQRSWLERSVVEIKKPFYVATREISNALFMDWIATLDADDVTRIRFEKRLQKNPRLAEDENHPVIGVSWHEAARFCNWLSERDGRASAYAPVQFEKGHEYYGTNYVMEIIDSNNDGYRMPWSYEWEYACRAKTASAFPFAAPNNYEMLVKYSWIGELSEKTGVSGTKMPNDWGLFDMLGNAAEWCNESYSKDNKSKYVMGGHNQSEIGALRSSYIKFEGSFNVRNTGIRIVFD